MVIVRLHKSAVSSELSFWSWTDGLCPNSGKIEAHNDGLCNSWWNCSNPIYFAINQWASPPRYWLFGECERKLWIEYDRSHTQTRPKGLTCTKRIMVIITQRKVLVTGYKQRTPPIFSAWPITKYNEWHINNIVYSWPIHALNKLINMFETVSVFEKKKITCNT